MVSNTTSTADGLLTSTDDQFEQFRNLGSLLLGTFLGLILYGMTVHQTYTFCIYQKEQTRILKPLIIIILALETIHSVLCMHASYEFLVLDRYLDMIPEKNRWSMDILNVFAAVIFCFTQSLFARRVYLMWPTYHGLMIVAGAAILTAGQFGTAIAATVLLYLPRTPEVVRKTRLLGVAHSAAVMVASALLAGALIHRLRLLRKRTDFEKTDHTLKVLITYTWNTGLLIFFTSLLSLVFAIVWSKSRVCVAVDIVATQRTSSARPSSYAIRVHCVLMVPSLQAGSGAHGYHWNINGRMAFVPVPPSPSSEAQWSSVSSAGPINIKVTTVTEVMTDGKDHSIADESVLDLKGALSV
ncbi:uncharacterized protein TRAVEDRAFT_53369 [Trametes versicolor FP-101664 SS1]|uniref:uncharacterized protein n=1 Tax=Trametes versicolor (strain FP-101664) TaxID=717944 RepID=UPI0004623A05|nr:uncharacterized protein TRAVEDRAFT_53369 [Trametes versicolor FP-101664 SS1]EIW52940.1 hypothetical protein TRAVEDRAFT_53369 [Trametes versicolor FP-101664 SS1]